jgi:hypothetical protein
VNGKDAFRANIDFRWSRPIAPQAAGRRLRGDQGWGPRELVAAARPCMRPGSEVMKNETPLPMRGQQALRCFRISEHR